MVCGWWGVSPSPWAEGQELGAGPVSCVGDSYTHPRACTLLDPELPGLEDAALFSRPVCAFTGVHLCVLTTGPALVYGT